LDSRGNFGLSLRITATKSMMINKGKITNDGNSAMVGVGEGLGDEVETG
jgi:hypothetical protein